MNKTIKISQETYEELDQIRLKGETWGQAVAKAVHVYNELTRIKTDLLIVSAVDSERPGVTTSPR